jgi:dihydrofolate reductase
MNAIVVVDANWAIGRDGGLLFSLPTDMKRFRSLTLGGTVIMGRKTLDSFPDGRPLPKRRNIVVTSNADLERAEVETAPTTQAAVELAADTEPDQVWVIGGGSIYAALLAQCKRVYLTRVDTAAPDADTFFPNLDKLPGWEVEHTSDPVEESGVTYRFIEYVNRKCQD